MTKLELIAKRIGCIGNEIDKLKAKRDINLQKCHGSSDEMFDGQIGKDGYDNCLLLAFKWSKDDREESRGDYDYSRYGSYTSFSDTLHDYGCINCKAAYKAKQDIGKLKQERGRLVGNISKIGKSL